MQPRRLTVPFPVKTVPLQQKLYDPVAVSNTTTLLESESSCKLPLKTVTVKLHIAVLFAASFAVQVTVLTPGGKLEPLGGEQLEVTVKQLSETTGDG